MSAVDDVRAKLRDRQVKAGARGTVEEWIPLDLELIDQLSALQTSLIDAQTRALAADPTRPEPVEGKTKKRLSDPPSISLDKVLSDDPEVVQLQEEVVAAEKALQENSLRLVFRSVGSLTYSAIVNRHPEADENALARQAFLNDLLGECLHEVWTASGEKLEGMTWAEICSPNGPDSEGPLSYGEWQQLAQSVSDLNRRKVDYPFSLRSSGRIGS